MAKAPVKTKKIEAPKEGEPIKNPEFSMDDEIGKGLSASKESSSIESDFNMHPKFDKFKKEKG